MKNYNDIIENTDLISRQMAIEVARRMYDADMQEMIFELELLPSIKPKPICEDAVSISKVLEVFSDIYWFDDDSPVVSKEDVDKIYERLRQLPLVEPIPVE